MTVKAKNVTKAALADAYALELALRDAHAAHVDALRSVRDLSRIGWPDAEAAAQAAADDAAATADALRAALAEPDVARARLYVAERALAIATDRHDKLPVPANRHAWSRALDRVCEAIMHVGDSTDGD